MLLVAGDTTATVVVELCVVKGTVVAPELDEVEVCPAGDVVGETELTTVDDGELAKDEVDTGALLLADKDVVAGLGAEVDTEGEEDTIPAEVLDTGLAGLVLVPGGARDEELGPTVGPLLELDAGPAEERIVVEVPGEDTTTLDVPVVGRETDAELEGTTAAVVEVEGETAELAAVLTLALTLETGFELGCPETTVDELDRETTGDEVAGELAADELDGGITWLGELDSVAIGLELDPAGVPEGDILELAGGGLLVAGTFEVVGLPAGCVVWAGELETGVGLDEGGGVCISDDDDGGVVSDVAAVEDGPSGVVLGLAFPGSVVDVTSPGGVVDESGGGVVVDGVLDDDVVVLVSSTADLIGTGHAAAAMPPKVTT